MIQSFIELCKDLNIPMALEKTEWADTVIVFLGILLDGANLLLSIPIEKRDKALKLLNEFSDKKKATIKQLQVLTGYLNFLTKAIFVGRTFTRRMYAKASVYQKGRKLKQHHHVWLDLEFKFDCEVWCFFCDISLCRPMIDLDKAQKTTIELNFSSDASANVKLGFGAVFENDWL